MNKAIIAAAALLLASPALAQTSTQGAKRYAPGQEMHNSTQPLTAPGASEFAPGHQKNTAAGPGHSESAPGQRSHTTTTGSNTKRN